jgi:hypothetical protein
MAAAGQAAEIPKFPVAGEKFADTALEIPCSVA